MYNPGSYSDYNLEWIEIINTEKSSIRLNNWSVNDNSIDKEIVLEPSECLIICRDLFDKSPEKDSFEEIYGDGSGKWGDKDNENGKIVELSISLINSSDKITIKNEKNSLVDELEYESDMGGDNNDKSLEIYSNDRIVESKADMGTPNKPLYMARLSFYHSNVDKKIIVYDENMNELFKISSKNKEKHLYHLRDNTKYNLKIEAKGYKLYEREININNENKNIDIKLEKKKKYNVEFVFKNQEGSLLNEVKIDMAGIDREYILSSNDTIQLVEGDYRIFISRKNYLTVSKLLNIDKNQIVVCELPELSDLKINELDFKSESTEVEWIELLNVSDSEVILKEVGIQDKNMIENNEKLMLGKQIKINDYIILTSNKDKFQSNYKIDKRVYEIPKLFAMNDTEETIRLSKNNNIIESIEYENSMLKGKNTSLERINSKYKAKKFNFYPSFKKTPLERNSVYNLVNDDIELIITEVYPFSDKEYIELMLKDSGNKKGALLGVFKLTDFENSYKIKSDKVYNENEFLIIENKLTLKDTGDQVVLKSFINEKKLEDMFCYKKKYANLDDEELDFKELEVEKSEIFKYEDKDYTKSFNKVKNEWRYTKTSKKALLSEINGDYSNLNINKKVRKNDKFKIKYDFNSKKEIILKIYDVGGKKRLKKKFYLEGEGTEKFRINLEKGRFLYFMKLRETDIHRIKRGCFVVY